MTCSTLSKTGCCVFLFAALAGCGSSNSKPAPDTTARDASLPQDVIVGADSSSGDLVAARDAISVADIVPGLDVTTATSSVQRIADPQVPSEDSTTLASDNAAFAFAAYQQLITTNSNLVFSPASISIALAMTYAGAAGTTATEIAHALHFTLPPERLHPAFNALDQALALRGQGKLDGDGVPMRLHIVNALWTEQTYTFKTDFLNILAANYGAGVNLLDFANAPDPSRLTINAWVADQTENKIQDPLPPGSIDSLTKLVLTNAVYFSFAWNTPFSPASTSDGSFTLLDGSSVTVKFMSQTSSSFLAMQGTNFVAASLPYADNRLSLLLVVPDAGKFSQVESSLDTTALGTLIAALTGQQIVLALPRFRIETGTSLKDLLETLGMRSAFTYNVADFSGMDGTRELFVSTVIHKAFIDVTEAGTVAAATTAVGVGIGGLRTTTLTVRADRPFLYFLRDQPTGAILFMGRVLDPSKN